ncbi:beta-caryophyllene synthase [Tanacetum coccineum]
MEKTAKQYIQLCRQIQVNLRANEQQRRKREEKSASTFIQFFRIEDPVQTAGEWSGGGRGVKEKNKYVDAKDGVSPFVTDETVVKEKQSSLVDTNIPTAEMDKLSSLDDTTVLGSFPPLSTPVTTAAGNAPGKSSYANVTGKPSGKKLNIRTLFTPGRVAYPVVANYVRNTWGKYRLVRSMFSSSTGLFSFQFSSMDGLDAMLENGPWFIRNNPLILKKWHPDENLLKEDVSTIPVWVKLHGVPVTAFSDDGLSAIATKLGTPLMLDSYTSDMCMQSWGRSSYARVMIELQADYEWKPARCATCKVFGHMHEECPKNTCIGEKKTVKKPSKTSRGVLKGVEPTIEVSNSNPFDVLNSVDNEVEFGTNGGTTNLVNNGATSSGSSFMNIDNDREFASNTPIVPTSIVESDSEVEVVFDETANLRIPTSGKDGSDKGYGTNILLEQSRDSYPDNDDYDPYDDDMYENHDLSEHLQSICDDLDITHHIPDVPIPANSRQQVPTDVLVSHTRWVKASKEIVCLMLVRMTLDLQKNLEHFAAYDMLREYIDNFERLGHPVSLGLAVSLILTSLSKEYDGFVQNYNIHEMRKTVNELHAMLKLHESGLPRGDVTHVVLAIKAGKIYNNKGKKLQAAKDKNHGNSKAKLAYAPKAKILLLPKKSALQRTQHAIIVMSTQICNTTQGIRGSKKQKPGALNLYVRNGHRAAV